jgi:hypothetical protein
MTMLTTVHSATTPALRRSALVLVARLRRLFNGWVAAAIAYHERRIALHALNRRSLRKNSAAPQAARHEAALNENHC